MFRLPTWNKGWRYCLRHTKTACTLGQSSNVPREPKVKHLIPENESFVERNFYRCCISARHLLHLNTSYPQIISFVPYSCLFSTSKQFPSVSRSCWKCGRDTNPEKELFFCKCGIVQTVAPSVTYFDLLREDISFDLDTKTLGVVFRETQKHLHPDMFSSKSKVLNFFNQNLLG